MLPLFLLRLTGGNKALAWLAIVGAALLVAGLGFLAVREMGVRAERDRQAAADARADLKAAKVGAVVRETASTERIEDSTATAQAEKEFIDAGKSLPDAVPSDRRRAGLCVRVFDAGTDRAAMAECRRLGFAPGANTRR